NTSVRIVGLLALSLPLSAILAVRMPTVKANMNAAATAIMLLVIMEAPRLLGHAACIAVYSTAACDGRHEFGECRFGFELRWLEKKPAPTCRPEILRVGALWRMHS